MFSAPNCNPAAKIPLPGTIAMDTAGLVPMIMDCIRCAPRSPASFWNFRSSMATICPRRDPSTIFRAWCRGIAGAFACSAGRKRLWRVAPRRWSWKRATSRRWSLWIWNHCRSMRLPVEVLSPESDRHCESPVIFLVRLRSREVAVSLDRNQMPAVVRVSPAARRGLFMQENTGNLIFF